MREEAKVTLELWREELADFRRELTPKALVAVVIGLVVFAATYVAVGVALMALGAEQWFLPALLAVWAVPWLITERRAVQRWVRDLPEAVRLVANDWTAANPPRTHRLIRVLTTAEYGEFANSTADRSAYDRATQDVAVAAWLTARGQAHRLPPEFRGGAR